MSNKELSRYNLSELKGLLHEIDVEINRRKQGDLAKARQQILAIASEVGVPVEELISGGTKKSNNGSGRKVPPQYQNPGDESQTWSGRGRQPKWIAAGIANGKEINDYRI
jgi:DNA-binding protein H-NS